MIILKIVSVAIAAMIVSALLIRNTNKWARSLQRYYIVQSNKISGNSGSWDKPWRLGLFKALLVFFGLMAILGIYVVIFSFQQ